MTEEKENLCCDAVETHEEPLKIVEEKMPDETELDSLAELFKVLEIQPGSVFCLYCLKQRSVSVTWQRR